MQISEIKGYELRNDWAINWKSRYMTANLRVGRFGRPVLLLIAPHIRCCYVQRIARASRYIKKVLACYTLLTKTGYDVMLTIESFCNSIFGTTYAKVLRSIKKDDYLEFEIPKKMDAESYAT